MAESSRGEQIILQISDLGKSYGPQTILDRVNLSLKRAERAAIMGPSGSGKSTLLNCLAGLEIPDSGQIRFMGKDLATIGEAAVTRLRRESLTSIFQFFHLLPTLRAWENVEFPLLLRKDPREERRQKVDTLLDEVGLSHRAQAMPSELSGGEMQRLAIARALITEPALILADEPTGSLDSKTSERVLDLLKILTDRHQTALLMVTHDKEASAICSRLLHMRDGRLLDEPA